MKTPELIKKGLECCHVGDCECGRCPYQKTNSCYIQQLESRLAQVERERDAAADCIQNVYTLISKPAETVTSARVNAVWALYAMNDYFRHWRGVCEANTEEPTA